MSSQQIPLNATWYLQGGVECTPDNGFFYIATRQIVYIPEITGQQIPEIKVFTAKRRMKSIDFNPNWLEVKEFATLSEDHAVHVWSFNESSIIKGHTVHLTKYEKNNSHCDIAYTLDSKILSVDENNFVKYCTQSNTFIIEPNFRKFVKNAVVMLKTSPYDKDIFAAGCKDGLVLLMSLKKMEILYKLRGHDTEITSIDWMLIPNKPKQVVELVVDDPVEKVDDPSKKLKELLDPLNNVDTFDIYSYDHLENEFGTIQEKFTEEEETAVCEFQEKEIEQNENFNFIEACQNLMEDIICGIGDKDESLNANKPGCSSALNQFAHLKLEKETPNDSMVTVLSAPASAEKDDFLEECHKVKDFIVVSKIGDEVDVEENCNEDKIYLATGSKESWIWLWDSNSGTGVHRINMKFQCQGKPAFSNNNRNGSFIVLKWVDENTLISNNPNGHMVQWNIKEKNNKVTSSPSTIEYPAKSVIGLCSSRLNKNKIFWTTSVNRQLLCVNLKGEILADFHTIVSRISSIDECPLDLNKIAFGCTDKRICILNASNIKSNVINLHGLMNKIQNNVSALAWHPEKENLLAFGTLEGRVGIYDTNKNQNVPVIMPPFTGKEIYSLVWCKLTDDSGKTKLALFALSADQFVYFYETKDKKSQAVSIPIKNPSTISTNGTWLGVGRQNGDFVICELNEKFTRVCEERVFDKYVSCLAWNPLNKNKLAVASAEKDIYIFDCSNPSVTAGLNLIGVLKGHLAGITSLKWNHNLENYLVSSSIDGSVRVWDCSTLESISVRKFDCCIISAMFSPIDDNFIISGGLENGVQIYDFRNFHDVVEAPKKPSRNNHDKGIEWAAPFEKIILKSKRKNRIKKEGEVNVEELTDCLQEVQLNENGSEPNLVSPPKEPKQYLNSLTVMHLTTKELQRDCIKSITNLLDGDSEAENLTKKLFSSDRNDVQEVLMKELENHKVSKTEINTRILLSQLVGNLKDEITSRITTKTLNPDYISLAPTISHEFWRKCCDAYGHQCIEKGCALIGVPYFLACHEIKEAIDSLCESNYFKEAWIIAKIRREEDDPIFNIISTRWLDYLIKCGNFTSAALLYTCMENYPAAENILNKIKNPTDEIMNLIQLLKSKI